MQYSSFHVAQHRPSVGTAIGAATRIPGVKSAQFTDSQLYGPCILVKMAAPVDDEHYRTFLLPLFKALDGATGVVVPVGQDRASRMSALKTALAVGMAA